MARGIYVQEGGALDYRNGGDAAIAYGEVVVLAGRIGVAESAIAVGALGAVSVGGVYELPADTGTEYLMGDGLYWDATGERVTKTATGNTPCGWAAAAKPPAATVALVKIG